MTFADLSARIAGILKAAGLGADHARAVARVIAAGERDGGGSHGIHRIALCMATLRGGKVVTDAVPALRNGGSAVVRVDAGGGFSCLATEIGAAATAERAREHGLAALVVNDCVHFSALWPEVEMFTERGLAALALCPSYAAVAPFGGNLALLGTNPLAFGWPRPDKPPFLFDFATSVAARGEIEVYRQAGKPLPKGWAVDAAGQPTTDPDGALAGAMLPFGAHKGSAISIMIELLAGALIGDLTSKGALDELGALTMAPRHGELILVFDPVRLSAGRGVDPFASAEALFAGISEQGARLPSERRYAARAQAEANGIPLSAEQEALLARYEAEGFGALD